MSLCNDALPVLGGKGGIYIKGSNGTQATFRVEQRQYWGTGSIRNISFIICRGGGGVNLYQRNIGTGTPLEWPLQC